MSFGKVTDIDTILEMGAMITPVLVIGGEVIMSDKVPSVEEIIELIEK